MAVINPSHLLEQAEQLISPPAGAPRQADIRRAISAAYYAAFHFILAAAADEMVGITKRSSTRYTLVYRSINHSALKKLCEKLSRGILQPDILKHFHPTKGHGANLQFLASALIELQENRHLADYDPSQKLKLSDARRAIDTAKLVMGKFDKLSLRRRQSFIALLCFSSR